MGGTDSEGGIQCMNPSLDLLRKMDGCDMVRGEWTQSNFGNEDSSLSLKKLYHSHKNNFLIFLCKRAENH